MMTKQYFFEKNLAGNVRWPLERAVFDQIGIDNVKARPMTIKEVFKTTFDPVARPF